MSKNPIDVHVGERLRAFRQRAEMNQTQLAERLGVKFQQVQKYETGANRISASRMWMAANALGIRVEQLFEGLTEDTERPARFEAMTTQEADLLASFRCLKEDARGALMTMISSMARGEGEQNAED